MLKKAGLPELKELYIKNRIQAKIRESDYQRIRISRRIAGTYLAENNRRSEANMKRPVLCVMAAGMGSRYGGLKQMDPMDNDGHIIMDFSVYDAVRAGFQDVIFIIKRENESDFRSVIGDRLSSFINVKYAFQELDNIPEGFEVPEGRVKPWGTGHAVLSAERLIDGPFVVINADDYYGVNAFKMAYDFLAEHGDAPGEFMMTGFRLGNTLTDNGHVSRGVCSIDQNGMLTAIKEHTHIERRGEGAADTEDNGKTWIELSPDVTVSMNMWGFSSSMLEALNERFPLFLKKGLAENPLKCEYFLPFVVDELLSEGKASVKVMTSDDKWYGVTYKEDKPMVTQALQKLKDEGVYPQKLWE